VPFVQRVPALLIASRFVLGPLLVFLSVRGYAPVWIILVLLISMLSDIFDGVIARRLKIATAPLRVMDSRADAWFFICVGIAAWLTVPEIIRAYWIPLSTEVVLQVASYTYDLIRYGRIASLHAYTAKAWGMSLYFAAAGLLAFHTGALIWLAFGLGIASAIDALAIKLILPGWQHDVLSAFHAWRQRPR
jgi:CDP-diacylglycerol--glycerol-3-phosphate 3-phosphatidyltransferase